MFEVTLHRYPENSCYAALTRGKSPFLSEERRNKVTRAVKDAYWDRDVYAGLDSLAEMATMPNRHWINLEEHIDKAIPGVTKYDDFATDLVERLVLILDYAHARGFYPPEKHSAARGTLLEQAMTTFIIAQGRADNTMERADPDLHTVENYINIAHWIDRIFGRDAGFVFSDFETKSQGYLARAVSSDLISSAKSYVKSRMVPTELTVKEYREMLDRAKFTLGLKRVSGWGRGVTVAELTPDAQNLLVELEAKAHPTKASFNFWGPKAFYTQVAAARAQKLQMA